MTLNVTVADAPGAMVFNDIPEVGVAAGRGVPLTVTLPVTKLEPAGILSPTMTLLTFSMPLLVVTML
ncbi:hypothetical protein D3C81_2230730 [compost metagenome]